MNILDIKTLLKNLKLHESTISMILGAIVIIVTGILIINYFDGKRGETISTIETEESTTLPTTHKIAEGEDLWKIAEKYYRSGYNWVDIAKENNISDPNQIVSGEELTIPNVQPRLAEAVTTPTQQPEIISPALTQQNEAQTDSKKIHTVTKDENLWKIAEKYYRSGYNWVDIAKENNLKSSGNIEIGQKLIIPNVNSKTLTTSIAQESSEPISGATYTVVKDDSLWKIAIRAYGDGYKWVDIAKENKLNNPNIIHPGNSLSLPR